MSSKRTCPKAPNTPKGELPQTESIPSGTLLTRFRTKPTSPATAYPANSFNPNIGKTWEIAGDGARFNPFPVPSGGNAPSLYAPDSYAAAALESVFHDVPHEANPEFARSRVLLWQYVQLRTKRELRIVMLTNPQLRQLHVPHRKESLREDELIHTPASQYPRTRTWAKFLYDHIPALDGLAWRPRLGGHGTAYMFFGDRFNSTDFEIVGLPTDLDSAVEYPRITAVATASNIHIIDGR